MKTLPLIAALAAALFTSACAQRECRHYGDGIRGPRGPVAVGGVRHDVTFRVTGDYSMDDIKEVTETAKAEGGTPEEIRSRILEELPEAKVEIVNRGSAPIRVEGLRHIEIRHREVRPRSKFFFRSSGGDCGPDGRPIVGVRVNVGGPLFPGFNRPPEIDRHSVMRGYHTAPHYSFSKAGHLRVEGGVDEYMSQDGIYKYAPSRRPVPFGH